MANSHSPVICVTCRRSFPEDLTQGDVPQYFAQHALRPTSDGDSMFGNEALTITRYIRARSEVLFFGPHHIEQKTYATVFELIRDLSQEADRRLTLALDAMDERWQRRQDQKGA